MCGPSVLRKSQCLLCLPHAGFSGCGSRCGWFCLRLLAILFSVGVVCLRIYFRICVILSSKFCATLKTALGVVRGPEVFVQVVTLCVPVPLATPLPPAFQLAPLCLFSPCISNDLSKASLTAPFPSGKSSRGFALPPNGAGSVAAGWALLILDPTSPGPFSHL